MFIQSVITDMLNVQRQHHVICEYQRAACMGERQALVTAEVRAALPDAMAKNQHAMRFLGNVLAQGAQPANEPLAA